MEGFIIKNAAIWVPSFLAVSAFVIAIIVAIRYKIPAMNGRIDKVELTSHIQEVTAVDMANTVKKHEIYENGSPLYQHVTGCTKFQGTFCGKVEEVKIEIVGIKTQLQGISDDRVQAAKDLTKTMTRVETMIQQDRTKELSDLAAMIVKQVKSEI